MKKVYTIFYKVNYKINQYFNAYILQKSEALLALDFIRKDRRMDFRHRYILGSNPIIFDCGGYKGDWTAKILNMYQGINPHIYVFEIASPFIQHLKHRFQYNKNVQIFPFGLGGENKTVEFSVSDIATSVFSQSSNNETESGEIKDVNKFLEENEIEEIDLLKMNIEGGEYELLESLISSGFVKRCKNIQIQFHNYGDWSIIRRNNIKNALVSTHFCTYDFEWTFENWQLRDIE